MASKEELIKKFKLNTGAQEPLVSFFLEAAGWHLEQAQEMFYESVDDGSSGEEDQGLGSGEPPKPVERKESKGHEENGGEEKKPKAGKEKEKSKAKSKKSKSKAKSKTKKKNRVKAKTSESRKSKHPSAILEEEFLGESKVWFNPEWKPDTTYSAFTYRRQF